MKIYPKNTDVMQKIKDNFKLVKFISLERVNDHREKVNTVLKHRQTRKNKQKTTSAQRLKTFTKLKSNNSGAEGLQ